MGSFVFPSNTVTVFRQTNAPLGWTKLATNNDVALRLVNGTGGGSGGSALFSSVHPTVTQNWPFTTTFSTPFPGTTGAAPAASVNLGGHAHSSILIPPVPTTPVIFQYPFPGTVVPVYQSWTPTSLGSVGGGLGHSHPFSINTTGSVSLPNWTLRYVDCILCSKK